MHRRLDVLHGVVHGEAAGHHAARRVDIEMDRLLRVLGFQEQQLRANQCGHGVVDFAVEEDDPLAQKSRIDVEGPFSTARLFDNHRDELHRFAHGRTPAFSEFLWLSGGVRPRA
jgi:hypothetical protein